MSEMQTELNTTNPARRLDWRDGLLLLLVMGIASWIRLTHIDQGLSFDELWHLASTVGIGNAISYYTSDVVHHNAICITSLDNKQNLWHVWNGMDGILHPPLFIVALRVWREVFGESDFAAHLFSICCGVLSVGFTYLSAKLAMNRTAAALAGLTLACAQTQVYFSQEVRAYSMIIAIGSVAVWLMTQIRVLGPTRGRVVALAWLTLPLLLTHYFTAGACLAIAIYLLTLGPAFRKPMLLSLIGAAMVYAIVWLPFAIGQLDDLNSGDVFLRSSKGPLHSLMLASGAPFRLLVERDYQIEMTPLLSVALFVVPWVLVRRMPALQPWVIWLSVSVGTILLLDWARGTVHSAYIRYLAIASPAVPLLFIGTIWAQGWKSMSYVFGALMSFAGAIYLFSGTRVLLDAEDLTPITRIMEPEFEKGDAIISAAGEVGPIYMGPIAITLMHSRVMFPTTLVTATKPLTPEMVAELGAKRIWLVGGELPVDVETFVPGSRLLAMKVATPQIKVRLLTLEPAPGSAAATQPN